MHITEYFVILYSELQEIMNKFKVAYLHHQSMLNLEDNTVKQAGNDAAIEADKKAGNEVFCGYLLRVRDESQDERHNVKKGVNWALRQIGKRNRRLNREAIRVAKQIQRQDSRAARWIASDALRELNRWA